MQIDRIAEIDLTDTDEAGIADLLARCFTTDFGGRSFYKQRHQLRIVARDGDRIIGHMALTYRAIRIGGQLTDVAGLAEVATDPDRRGEGIAGRLLTEVISAARHSRARFFLLFGDRPIYAGAGFRSAPGHPMRWVGMDGAVTGTICDGTSESLMVLPLGPAAWDATADLDLLGPLF